MPTLVRFFARLSESPSAGVDDANWRAMDSNAMRWSPSAGLSLLKAPQRQAGVPVAISPGRLSLLSDSGDYFANQFVGNG